MHYFLSPVISKSSSAELRSQVIFERNAYFHTLTLERFLYSYPMNNWYDNITWNLWGRRQLSKIPFSRTAMKVESHWSMLKRQYLLPYNIPRVDLLVHILTSSLMVKFEHDYEAMKLGRKKPFRWASFVRM